MLLLSLNMLYWSTYFLIFLKKYILHKDKLQMWHHKVSEIALLLLAIFLL
jgi:hypothetical protein